MGLEDVAIVPERQAAARKEDCFFLEVQITIQSYIQQTKLTFS